eukprot:CAMPEP_0119345158 /NCGR_PEP_ID=MMETSP1333-20130426/107341_1 /TAXON_ID=418940 /ORGANISM="Scyphosphaera apsteinii, Strain RCC1455" /LENGTH=392 /DNA_ID=CAMNT_0007357615 /DNA_START=18 /DNA_END=1193 /DNA_ORIENTATION=-
MQLSSLLAQGSLVQPVFTDHARVENVKLRMEPFGSQFCLLQHAEFGNLRIAPNGRKVHFAEGARGKWARFLLEDGDTPDRFRFKSFGHHEDGRNIYLTAAVDGTASLQFAASEGPGCEFTILPMDSPYVDAHGTHSALVPEPPPLQVTDEMKRSLVRDGYLVLRGAVQPELVDDALRTINAQLGKGPAAWDEADEEGKAQLGGGVRQSRAIMNLLYRSPAFAVAEQLLGRTSRPTGSQIALRFPDPPDKSRTRPPKATEQWHIDGMQKHHQSPFQLLCGVALSSQPDNDFGNLGVYPGAHVKVFDAVKQQRSLRERGVEESTALQDPWLGHRPILAEEATQMRVQPGDVIFAHQKLPHRICLNRSPHVRYQVYFRLSAVGYEPNACLGGDVW